jgi:hypothetical protein
MDVKLKLVADINRKGEGARVVHNPVRQEVRPRVDIKTEVETGQSDKGDTGDKGRFEGMARGTSAQEQTKIAKDTTGAGTAVPVNVGKGGGVMGMLLQQKAAVPDPEAMTWQQLRVALTPHFGKAVVVTNYDREEASNLAQAAKSHSIGDNFGTLRDVKEDGVVLEKDGALSTVKREFWAIARIKTTAGEVIAQDPAYPKHFSD